MDISDNVAFQQISKRVMAVFLIHVKGLGWYLKCVFLRKSRIFWTFGGKFQLVGGAGER